MMFFYDKNLLTILVFKIIMIFSNHIFDTQKHIFLIEISKKGVLGQNYNIGSGVELNNIYITKKIISCFKKIDINLANKAKFIFVKDRPGHDLRYSLNSSKIKNKLKWDCTYNFDEGIKSTVLWYINKFNKNFFNNNDFKKRLGLKI